MLSVYITCKDKKEAEMTAHLLLDNKLIVCANIFPINSIYLWKAKKETSDEYALLCKTLKTKFSVLTEKIKKVHSYKVPFISAWEEFTTQEVEEWIKGELK